MRDILENKLGVQMEYEEELPEYHTKLAMYPIGGTYIELLESDTRKQKPRNGLRSTGRVFFTSV